MRQQNWLPRVTTARLIEAVLSARFYCSTCSRFLSLCRCDTSVWQPRDQKSHRFIVEVKQQTQAQDFFFFYVIAVTENLLTSRKPHQIVYRRLFFLKFTIKHFCFILLVPPKLAPYPNLLGCVTVDLLPPLAVAVI